MSEKELANYKYTVYQLEESLKCELDELPEDWTKNPSSAYKRGELNACKEALYFLTLDQKWQLSLEELANVLLTD